MVQIAAFLAIWPPGRGAFLHCKIGSYCSSITKKKFGAYQRETPIDIFLLDLSSFSVQHSKEQPDAERDMQKEFEFFPNKDMRVLEVITTAFMISTQCMETMDLYLGLSLLHVWWGSACAGQPRFPPKGDWSDLEENCPSVWVCSPWPHGFTCHPPQSLQEVWTGQVGGGGEAEFQDQLPQTVTGEEQNP